MRLIAADVIEEALRQPEDCGQPGGGDGADTQARRQNVQSDDVPKRAEQDVRQRRVRVGELRDEPAVMVEVQRGRNVVAALVPVVGQAEQGQVAERDRCEEQKPEQPRWQGGDAAGESDLRGARALRSSEPDRREA